MNSSTGCNPVSCEQNPWPIGASGQCNNTTGECGCPEGYSGSFILVTANDCHVSKVFKEVVVGITFGMAVFTTVSAVICFFKVAWELSHAYRPVVVPKEDQIKQSSSRLVVNKSVQKPVLARKWLTLRTIIGFIIYGACEVYRAGFLLQDVDAFALEVPHHVILGFGFGNCACTYSIFAFLYIYTTSLPKGGKMAAVLGIAYDAERYQRLLNWVFKYNTIFCASLLALVNLAYVWKASAWFVSNYIPLEILCQAIVTVDLSGVAYFVYYMNVPLFKKIIRQSANPNSMPKLKAAIFRCEICIYLGIISISSFAVCIGLVWTNSRFNFIPFIVLAVNIQFCVATGSYLLGWDFVSIDKPKKHNLDLKVSTTNCSSGGH